MANAALKINPDMKLMLREVLDRPIGDLPNSGTLQKCAPDTPIEKVMAIFQSANVGSVLIAEGGKPIGIITERDYLKKIAFKNLSLKDVQGQKVSSFMTPNPKTMQRQETMGQALLAMRKGQFRHLVVTDSYSNAERVLSMRSIMDYLADAIEPFIQK